MYNSRQLITIIIPFYNEAPNLPLVHKELAKYLDKLPYHFEIIFVDDGSSDESVKTVRAIKRKDGRVRLLKFARNFGKEAALSAGLHGSNGDAAIMLDADLQMPPSLIGKFINKWKDGADVVIGVAVDRNMSWHRELTSRWFYKILGMISHTQLTPHSTDFRLIDRNVINEFNRLTEKNRITRGLIDWLGFNRKYIHFNQRPRAKGNPTYTYKKLVNLAINTFTSYSLVPLKLAGYIGVLILTLSIPVGLFMTIEKLFLGDPLQIRGTAFLAILILTLVGLILACLGLMSLYIANIHSEVMNRPLYIAREDKQALDDEDAALIKILEGAEEL